MPPRPPAPACRAPADEARWLAGCRVIKSRFGTSKCGLCGQTIDPGTKVGLPGLPPRKEGRIGPHWLPRQLRRLPGGRSRGAAWSTCSQQLLHCRLLTSALCTPLSTSLGTSHFSLGAQIAKEQGAAGRGGWAHAACLVEQRKGGSGGSGVEEEGGEQEAEDEAAAVAAPARKRKGQAVAAGAAQGGTAGGGRKAAATSRSAKRRRASEE